MKLIRNADGLYQSPFNPGKRSNRGPIVGYTFMGRRKSLHLDADTSCASILFGGEERILSMFAEVNSSRAHRRWLQMPVKKRWQNKCRCKFCIKTVSEYLKN